MIRIKIRDNDTTDTPGKLLRFDESMSFGALLRKIANKLGISVSGDDDLTTKYQLALHGENVVVEGTDEINDGDDLVFQERHQNSITGIHVVKNEQQEEHNSQDDENEQDDSNPAAVTSQGNSDASDTGGDEQGNASQDGGTTRHSTGSQAAAKQENQSNSQDKDEETEEENDEDSVEVIAEVSTKDKRACPEDVISLSSDEDEDKMSEDGSIEEGSDAWEESDSEDDDKSENSDFEMDSDEEEKKKPARGGKTRNSGKAVPESPLQVIMEEKDVPAAPGKPTEKEENFDDGLEESSTLLDKAGRNKADQAAKDRIIKLLNTGFHDNSNENEAKNAMKLAQRLMRKHNLSQAILMKERDAKNKKDQTGAENDDEILKGGMVRVQIMNRKTGKPALYARWISGLTHPICDNFDVKCFYTAARGKKCSVTFYGIYTNCQLAGYAFRVAAERIAQMSAEYNPSKSSSFWGNQISTKSKRLSYALGVVEGIYDDVKRNIRREKERRLRKLERARQAVSKREAYEESDDEDNEGHGFNMGVVADDDNGSIPSSAEAPPESNSESAADPSGSAVASLGDNNDNNVDYPNIKKVSGKELDQRLEELEKQNEAALVLVNHKEKIAEKVLEGEGIKLNKGRKRKAIQMDHLSYRQGIDDAREIDINQRAIRDERKVKKEKKERS